MSPDGNTDEALRRELNKVKADLDDIQTTVNGPRNIPDFGLIARVKTAEQRIASIQEIQDRITRERAEAEEVKDRKNRFRSKVQVALIGAFGSLLVGIILLLLQIQAGVTP